jgi:hypothetical protein
MRLHRLSVQSATRSLKKYNVELYAMASLYLASKVEEASRKMRDFLSVFLNMGQRRKKLPKVGLTNHRLPAPSQGCDSVAVC